MLDLGGVGFDGLQDAGKNANFNIFVDDFVEKAGEPFVDGVEINGTRLESLAARKGEKFASERSGTIGLFADA